jgi:hypothetical protein
VVGCWNGWLDGRLVGYDAGCDEGTMDGEALGLSVG